RNPPREWNGRPPPEAPRTHRRRGALDALTLVEVIPESLRTGRMSELRQRLRLDLPDPFARHPELLADFFQGVELAVIEAKPEPDHAPLPLGELLQGLLDRFREQRPGGGIGGSDGARVLDEVTQEAVVLVAHRCLE